MAQRLGYPAVLGTDKQPPALESRGSLTVRSHERTGCFIGQQWYTFSLRRDRRRRERGSVLMREEEPLEGLVLHGRANNMLMAISRALLTPACILAIVAAIHHMWLGFGSSVYHLVLSNDKSQPERYGGITKVKDWPVLGAGSVMGDE